MAAIEHHLPIVQLDENDAAAGLALSIEAHWNQNERDWRFLLTKGIVFGVRDRDRALIATAALLAYTEREAWISMVLVTASCRRSGLATRLIEACLDTATKLRLTAWLDATPAGIAVYRLRIETAVHSNAGIVLPEGKLREFIAWDISAMGFDRRDLLGELSGRPSSQLISTGDAMVLVRDGPTGRHIGPLFADDPKRALALVTAVVRGESGTHLIDAVATQVAFIEGLRDAGWTIERPFHHMRFGSAISRPAELPLPLQAPSLDRKTPPCTIARSNPGCGG